MTPGKLLIKDRLLSRLRKSKRVLDPLQRLVSDGKVEVAHVQELALDPTSPIDSRVDAITILLAIRRGSKDVLRHLLNSGDRTIVIETLKAIRLFGTPWALPEIITGVRHSDDPMKRAAFAWALAGYPTDSKVESLLLNLMNSDDVPTVRDHAIESLGEFHSDRVVEALLQVLDRGPARDRFWALHSLGNLASDRATEAITHYLQDPTAIPDLGIIADEARRALTNIARRSR